MHLLADVFSDPQTTKVLHGADSDVVWLQRDFGLYLVNMFDTGQAARVLEFPSFGLAHLLETYANVKADKKYQLADWRVRPLPQEMFHYAREDTHYLLHVYDKLRLELLSKSDSTKHLLRAVMRRSQDVCLKRYEKPVVLANSHMALFNRHNYRFSAPQMRVFAALYAWRDSLARKLDEGVGTVLPNTVVFSIAESMPRSVGALLSCCTPTPALREHAAAAAKVIDSAIRGASSVPPSPALGAAEPAADGVEVMVMEEPEGVSIMRISAIEAGTETARLLREKWLAKQKMSPTRLAAENQPGGSTSALTVFPSKPSQGTGTSVAKAQKILQEINSMALLDIVAQVPKEYIAESEVKSKMDTDPPVLPGTQADAQPETATAEGKVDEKAEGTPQATVSDWLAQARQDAGLIKTEQGQADHELSVVDKYGGSVAKATTLKEKRTKKRKSTKVGDLQTPPIKKEKMGDAMASGQDEKPKEKARWH